jgi:branched-chain amino acid aminotransferase
MASEPHGGVMPGSQDFPADPRNAALRVWLNGRLVARDEARVSIFDAGFVLGDGVWEGLRLHKGALLFLESHLDRLFRGAADIALDLGLSRRELADALAETLRSNGMTDGAHVRLMATRGVKAAVNQDPRNALGKATLVIVAEYKLPAPESMTRGLSVVTSRIRTTPASMFDMRLNSHSRLPLIRALLDVIPRGGDEALMLDPYGFVASCNATNFFWVRDGEVRTSTDEFCFNGVTRANVINLCRDNHIRLRRDNFSLSDVHQADEAFLTGTFGGLTPVRSVDDNILPAGVPGPVTRRLITLYEALKDAEVL